MTGHREIRGYEQGAGSKHEAQGRGPAQWEQCRAMQGLQHLHTSGLFPLEVSSNLLTSGNQNKQLQILSDSHSFLSRSKSILLVTGSLALVLSKGSQTVRFAFPVEEAEWREQREGQRYS